MNVPHLKRPLRLRGLSVLALALSLSAPQAKAAMLFDDARVTSTRFDMAEGRVATGIKLSLSGVHLPNDPHGQARSLAFEVVKSGTDAENVAIALSVSDTGLALDSAQVTAPPDGQEPRLLITTKDETTGGMGAKIEGLDPQGRGVLATICTTLAEPTTVAAALGHLAQADQPAPAGLFQSAVLSLATKCRSDLAKAGVISGGFLSRDKLSARLRQSADGLLSAESVAIENWMGNTTDPRMSGSVFTLRAVEVVGLDARKAPTSFAAKSLLWDGHIDVPSRRRIALYGRVSQYPGADSGLFDAADNLSINLYPKAEPTKGLDAAIAESSRESLVLVEHVLSNLPLLQAAALETISLGGISITSTLPAEAAAFWSVVRFGDDASAVLDMVQAELFRRAYPDEKSVLALQDSLTKWQLYDGAVDGKTGPKTRLAFAAFERIVSGAANGTPSEVEVAALALWTAGPPPIPPALTGSLADALTPDQSDLGNAQAMATLQDLETEATGILSEIAAIEAEMIEMDTEKTAKISALETLLADCYCQGGRLCP